MARYSVELKDITKAYEKVSLRKKMVNALLLRDLGGEKVTALDNVSLRVKRGEVFGLLGPNGAGKTTMIKILTTILIPDSGSAKVDGFDVVDEDLEVRKRIGLLPEDSERGFIWRLTARTNLMFYAREYTVTDPKKSVEEVLKLVDLTEDDASKWFQKLSKGTRQKLALARAILPDSSVLFMDEPQRSLDILFVSKLKELIREKFGRSDRTIFLSSHDMHLIEETCSRIAVIDKGRIVAVKTVDGLKSLFKGLETLTYIMEVAYGTKRRMVALANKLGRLDGVDHVKPTASDKVEICVKRNSLGAINNVLHTAIEEGYNVLSLERTESNLEESILKLLKGGEYDKS